MAHVVVVSVLAGPLFINANNNQMPCSKFVSSLLYSIFAILLNTTKSATQPLICFPKHAFPFPSALYNKLYRNKSNFSGVRLEYNIFWYCGREGVFECVALRKCEVMRQRNQNEMCASQEDRPVRSVG